MARTKAKTNLKKLDALSDSDITKAIADDADAAPDMSAPPKGIKRVRGPQKKPTKQQVTLRLDRTVIEHFKAGGTGWQTRLNDHLVKTISVRKSSLSNSDGKSETD